MRDHNSQQGIAASNSCSLFSEAPRSCSAAKKSKQIIDISATTAYQHRGSIDAWAIIIVSSPDTHCVVWNRHRMAPVGNVALVSEVVMSPGEEGASAREQDDAVMSRQG